MDKKIAEQIADEKMKEILSSDKSRIINLLTESEHELLTREGVEYQVRANAFYETKEKKIIRILVNVDDQRFWSTFHPLTRCELIEGCQEQIYDADSSKDKRKFRTRCQDSS